MSTVVKIGQVYEETDPRMNGRRFRIIAVRHDGRQAIVANSATGRITTIPIDRLRSARGKHGYRLIEGQAKDAAEEPVP